MRAVIQRVSQASVTVDQNKVASIGRGLLILLGIAQDDTLEDVAWLSRKIAHLRIFNDVHGFYCGSLVVLCFSLVDIVCVANCGSFIDS